MTIIAFIGSVFSPYYGWAGRQDPTNHCALNVALYGRPHRWSMTERGRRSLRREPQKLVLGPNALSWGEDGLTIRIDDVTAPIPSRLKGKVTVRPGPFTDRSFVLDGNGRHRWWPVSPAARVDVVMECPFLKWSGAGYFDTNAGDEPLESGFRRWAWSRAPLSDGRAAILYEGTRIDGAPFSLAVAVAPDGTITDFEAPPTAALPRTLWRIDRATRADEGHKPTVVETLEDTPFYARSLIRSHLLGQPVVAMHEALDCERLARKAVRLMLPFRMPRLFW